jgi:hypothetical protein
MENTVAEEMYDFTKNRREKINLELSKIRSLYGREDVVYRFNAYKKAKDKDDIARKKGRSGYSGLPSARIELESACKSVGIEKTPDELIKDDSVIKTIHTRSEIISDQFLPILYKEYKNTPMTSDYMNRIIHRLTKSDTYIKKDDENRTIILKKFVMGGGKGFKTLNTGEIIEWAEEKMNASEKEQYDLQSDSQKKLELAVSRIDNSIFDRSLTQALKQTKCLIENFDKYVLMSKEGKIVDSNSNETIIISDIILKEITTIKLKNLMCKLRFEFTNVSVIENIKLLYNIFNNDYPANAVVEFIDFVAALNVDFKKQLHSLCYISREGKKKTLEERYCDVLKKRNRKMKLLNLCEDLANGDFKSNGGNTRKYLYYFAIMFDMSEALKKNDHYNEDTFISGKELQAMIRKKTGGLYNGYLFQDDVEMLKSIGLDIKWKKIKKSKKATEDIAEEGKVYALCGREYQNDSELDAIIKSLNIKLDKTLLWEILLERIVKKQDISRSTFIAVYYNYYLCFELDKISGVETFKDIYDDFKNKIDIELGKARFQRMSEKNILDLYVLISLCVFVVENDVLQSE